MPSPAMIVASIALVAAVAGSAVAFPGKNKVDKNDIQKGAVTKKALNEERGDDQGDQERRRGRRSTSPTAPSAPPRLPTVRSTGPRSPTARSEQRLDRRRGATVRRRSGPTGRSSNGGEGDCDLAARDAVAWLAGLGPVVFCKDPGGFVHLSGVASRSRRHRRRRCSAIRSDPGESEDGIIYTLPPGYLPDNSEIQGAQMDTAS